jgi:single-strand DNA-binding protein
MVASVNIACNERKYNKETQQYENGDATYLRGTLWRDYAENVANSLRKGDKVIAVGRLRMKQWEKDGQKRTSMELDIDEIGPTLRFVAVAPLSGGAVTASADEPAW